MPPVAPETLTADDYALLGKMRAGIEGTVPAAEYNRVVDLHRALQQSVIALGVTSTQHLEARNRWYRRWKFTFGALMACIAFYLWFHIIPSIAGL